jgi:hypothetical protein
MVEENEALQAAVWAEYTATRAAYTQAKKKVALLKEWGRLVSLAKAARAEYERVLRRSTLETVEEERRAKAASRLPGLRSSLEQAHQRALDAKIALQTLVG